MCYKMLCSSVVHYLLKSNMPAQKADLCKPSVVICGSHHISSSRARSNKILTAVPIFSMSSGSTIVVANTTGSKSHYTGNRQTGSNTISAHRTARNKVPTPVSRFSFKVISPWSRSRRRKSGNVEVGNYWGLIGILILC